MKRLKYRLGFAALVPAVLGCLHAQDISSLTNFRLVGREVQIHGSVSEGFVTTDTNNWLTMDTSKGSFAMTDAALNISSQLTDKFRIGAQVYVRNLGKLGNWRPQLDWGYADYRFKRWFGVRGGKVKTTLGLYNDIQDMPFLRTFSLLPQSVYPTDLRESMIAHAGGDVYGSFSPKGAGTFSYTVYAGHRSDSMATGYPYLLSRFGVIYTTFGGLQYGADFRWNTPLRGLLLGVSRLDEDVTGEGHMSPTNVFHAPAGAPVWEKSKKDFTHQFYGQYSRGRLTIDSEFRRYLRDQIINSGKGEDVDNVKGWYVASTYQALKKLQLGAYYSHYTITNSYQKLFDTSAPSNHIYDKVISARYDVTGSWYLKLEGHFMDGNGNAPYPNGFYPQTNPLGMAPTTKGLVAMTGWSF